MLMDGRPDPLERKAGETPFPFARMARKRDALDRLDLRFRWGRYGIRVLHCHLAAFAPGHVISFHKHSEFEFHFIPKGKGTVTFADGAAYELHEGLFYLTGPDVVHEQRSDDAEPMYELCLHCEIVPLETGSGTEWGDSLEVREADECIRLLQTMPPAPTLDRYQAMSAFLDAYRAWEEQPVGFYTTVKQTMIQILLRAARVHASPEDAGNIPERDMKDHRFRLAIQYIEDNAARPITLEEVAERVQVSPRQLQRIFQSEGRTTFRDWVEHVRLQRISSDLLQTERPIEEIALEHGFVNPNYLYPVFKHKFGMTPSAYRRLHGVR
ncbi:helix-turn-helix transcriptional regulator [Cohnella nanjingensis]|uniref:AraC family transcriptional regulator n=1 Tax=Cohnella nanjingensis TaxID=1387779 RepID=A0A7X0RUU0_9BACL|nr:helix-turn-helix domain-containing protein [Cohnella nanjingensis]MBB6674000.1 AraC family transcriptional regulator [Cohnella nanjingensis]